MKNLTMIVIATMLLLMTGCGGVTPSPNKEPISLIPTEGTTIKLDRHSTTEILYSGYAKDYDESKIKIIQIMNLLMI